MLGLLSCHGRGADSMEGEQEDWSFCVQMRIRWERRDRGPSANCVSFQEDGTVRALYPMVISVFLIAPGVDRWGEKPVTPRGYLGGQSPLRNAHNHNFLWKSIGKGRDGKELWRLLNVRFPSGPWYIQEIRPVQWKFIDMTDTDQVLAWCWAW